MTILNIIPVTLPNLKMVFILIICMIIAFIICIATKDNSWQCGTFGTLAIFLGIIAMIVTSTTHVPTGQYKYQVTIDDKVSFKEIIDKYEVLEVNGEIYTLKERDNNED